MMFQSIARAYDACPKRWRLGIGLWILLSGLAFGLGSAAPPSIAATPPSPIDALVAQARESGLRVIILDTAAEESPPVAVAGSAGPGALAAATVGRAVSRLREIVGAARGRIADLPAVLAAFAPNGSPLWPGQVAGIAVLGLILGHAVFRVVCLLVPAAPPTTPPNVPARSARVRASLRYALVGLTGVVFEVAFGLVLPAAVFGDAVPTRTVASVVIESALLIRVAMVFFRAALAPDDAGQRPVALADSAARQLWSDLRIGLIVIFVLMTPTRMILGVGAGRDLEALLSILAMGAAGLILILVILRNRGALQDLGAPAARRWWIAAIGYVAVAWLVSSARALLGLPHSIGLIGAPIVGTMIAVTLYALSLIVIDRLTSRARIVGAADAAPGRPAGEHWADRTALVFALAVAALYVADVWGADLRRADGRIGPVATAALTVFVGYAAWAAIHAAFDRRIAEEVVASGPMAADEIGRASVSRLGTLLPLFRNIILTAIVAIAAMLLLTEAGVNIAPLFAGAGILGLAIGFGAQTLIRDIFSGLFFLVDDAFRVGEYIATGGAKGTVERISIRSMQMRHQNGPLHTIPFGEIQQLTNYSRDWVIMKLPLRVTLDSDPERIRKLIKKLGEALLADPLVGPSFLEPLKSQGVLTIDNFGMVIRVKFMTRPGDQFVARRVVYARIHELFEHEGIEFAGRDVRVRVDPGAEADPRVAQVAAALETADLAEGAKASGTAAGDHR